MHRTTAVVVGAGHAGLATSACLSAAGVDHVILERDAVASSWRSRWDSLRLLTPNWQSRLPGFAYDGEDPDGYMSAAEVATFLSRYAGLVDAPVVCGAEVLSVRSCDDGSGFAVRTTCGDWRCRVVVVASGATAVPQVPGLAAAVPAGVLSITPAVYRCPDQLPPGGVLVAGAAATGVQVADELRRSGRDVVLAVGGHVRAPRVYRGRDIMWWLDAAGVLDERWDTLEDVERVRHLPSFQLVGSPGRTLDLNALQSSGVEVVGRVAGVRDGCLQLSGSLPNACRLADLKLGRLLDQLDEWAGGRGERFEPTRLPSSPPLSLNLGSGRISTIVWATGFRADLPWLEVPVLDRKGRVGHDGGVTPCPGLYVMGMPFQRRRKSTLIDGAAADATDLTSHLLAHLGGQTRGSAGNTPWYSRVIACGTAMPRLGDLRQSIRR